MVNDDNKNSELEKQPTPPKDKVEAASEFEDSSSDSYDDDTEDSDAPAVQAAPEPEEEELEEEPRSEPRRLPGFNNAQELLAKELPARATYVEPKLRSNLVGSITIHLTDSNENFLFDWTTEELKTGKIDRSAAPSECTIHLGSENLMKVAHGNLNPQIAMLSNKIRVDGRVSLAVYFFNLIAPRQRH